MIATHHGVKTRFIASLRMVYLSHSFFKLVLRMTTKDQGFGEGYESIQNTLREAKA
ncbi:hypothetical protein [Trichormus variabilis]|uniref:hypothetical protein n=1 Tax=Anabaena variabilis TaxID=264691 RepID=UPI000A622D07|nr:hypothetical protein [Trichormus variabilis]